MKRLIVLILGPLGHLGLLPAPLQLEFLRTMRDQMNPMHPGLPEVAVEIAALESRRA